MSNTDDQDDLAPSQTPGFKLGAQKTAKELAELDKQDESLNRWKASLGLGAAEDTSKPKVTVLSLELISDTIPSGKHLYIDLQNAETLAATTKEPITIKEGVEYHARIKFKVNHSITSGVRYLQSVHRAMMRVDKLEQMLGSYGPHPNGEAHVKNFDPEEAPSGMLARGTYEVKSRVIDDDGEVYAEWKWQFKIAKDWK